MKLQCTTACFINRYYNEDEVVTVDEKLGKSLLDYGYFREIDGPVPPKEEEPQEPGKRKKITVV